MARKTVETEKTDWADQVATFGEDIGSMPGCGPNVDDIEAEMLSIAHLEGDRRQEEGQDAEHFCFDKRQADTAADHIERIPDEMECFHLICSGRYALWDMVPAILELAAPAVIEKISIATLGFSKNNIAELVTLMDRGRIGAVSLLCSHYFKGTSGGICEYAAAEFAKRPAAKFLSLRTHCKIVAIRLSDGRTITIESSANLRNCKNIEQMTIFGSSRVYGFHVGWMEELFARGT